MASNRLDNVVCSPWMRLIWHGHVSTRLLALGSGCCALEYAHLYERESWRVCVVWVKAKGEDLAGRRFWRGLLSRPAKLGR